MRSTLPILIVLALAAPAAAQTGGATYQSGGVTVTTKPDGLVGKKKTFTGTAPAGHAVAVERYDEISREWNAIAAATADGDGAFTTRWKADREGNARIRARLAGGDARAATAVHEIAITLYKPQKATWYGPGFYGRRTACGQKLTKTLVGVAHKTHPCGTKIAFLYRGRTVTVPVVDRGPFANGAKWDLTSAAAERIGFTGTDTVGALQVASR